MLDSYSEWTLNPDCGDTNCSSSEIFAFVMGGLDQVVVLIENVAYRFNGTEVLFMWKIDMIAVLANKLRELSDLIHKKESGKGSCQEFHII